MMVENLSELRDRFGLIDIEVKNIPQCILQGIVRVRLHMADNIDEFYAVVRNAQER